MLLIVLSIYGFACAQGTVINGDRSIVGSLCVGSSGSPVDRVSLCAAPVASATRALLNLSNTPLSSGSASGTYIGANPAACIGNFWDFQLANAARSVLSCAGALTVVSSTNNLGIFAATASTQLAGVMSDETGTNLLVYSDEPVLTTPRIIYPFARTDTTARTVMVLSSNDVSNYHQLYIQGIGHASVQASRVFSFQTSQAGVGDAGIIALQPGSGLVGIGTLLPNEGLEMGTTLNIRIPNIRSTTGVRYVCVDTAGTLTSQSAACVGT